ncbi:S49 family peptidase [Oceanibaculum nanhaiense]|uniref:S49 family peptidase n=1 Tax=Oceanibaculum nanhaiense TaxID=1909734 RepID=UPI003D28548F
MSAAMLHRVAEYLSGQPIAMEPARFRAAFDAILPRLAGGTLDASAGGDIGAMKREATLERLATIVQADPVYVGGVGEYGVTAEGIAVIPVIGTLIDRFDWLASICGFVSYDAIIAMVKDAAAKDGVKGILLDIESPGGVVSGMLDCVDAIRAVARTKPVWASANSYAASAAYALATGASRISLPRLGMVGSVGAVTVHIDQSVQDKLLGLKFTAIYGGARKIDGWGHAPLPENVRAGFQARVDAARERFAASVAEGRSISFEAVMDTEAEVYEDQAAIDVGFADAIENIGETLDRMASDIATTTSPSGRAGRSTAAQAATTRKESRMAVNRNKPSAGAKAPNAKASAKAATEDKKLQDQQEDEALDQEEETDAEGEEMEPEAEMDEEEVDAEGDDEKPAGKKATRFSASTAASIAALCAEKGVPDMAAKLIKQGASMAQARKAVGAVAEIKSMVETARKIDGRLSADLADQLIRGGHSIASARKAVFDQMAELADTVPIRGQVAPGTSAPGAEGMKKAFAKFSKPKAA